MPRVRRARRARRAVLRGLRRDAPAGIRRAGRWTPQPTRRPSRTSAGNRATCHECGGDIAADGYCSRCGAKARSLRDHFTEQPAPWVAAVCDRGVRHSRNEDAVALEARLEPGSHAVLVVCDGVSSSTDSDVASLAAARAARDVLASSSPSGIGTAAAHVAATAKALDAAVDAANEAVIANTVEGPGEPASCTFVAAVVDASLLVVGWVGDSRAYWLPATGEPRAAHRRRLLRRRADRAGRPPSRGGDGRPGTRDHAVAGERRSRPPAADHLARSRPAGVGARLLRRAVELLLGADGPGGTGGHAGRGPRARTRSLLADALVDWANVQGGVDNITVALARIDPPGTVPMTPPDTDGRPRGGAQRGRDARWPRSQLRSTRTSSCPKAAATCTPSSRSPALVPARPAAPARAPPRRSSSSTPPGRWGPTRSPPRSRPPSRPSTRCTTASGWPSSPATTRHTWSTRPRGPA